MLDVALNFLTAELNSYLVIRGAVKGSDEIGKVEVGRLVDEAGKWAVKDDHVGATLVHFEEERVLRGQLPETTVSGGKHVVLEPRLRLNLHVLFAAKFQKYDEALRSLSLILTFFQSHPTFTPDTHPGLDPRLERLNVELQSPSFEQLNQVWAYVGAKHLPSALYKVRMVALQDTAPATIREPLAQIAATTLAR